MPSSPASRNASTCSSTESGSPVMNEPRMRSGSSRRTSATRLAFRSASAWVAAMFSGPSRVLVISAGSRPIRSQAASSTATLCRIVSTSPKKLHASA